MDRTRDSLLLDKKFSPNTFKTTGTIINRNRAITNTSNKSPLGIKESIKFNNVKKNLNNKKLKNVDTYTQTDLLYKKPLEAQTQTNVEGSRILITQELLGKTWLTDEFVSLYVDLLNRLILSDKPVHILNPLIVHAIKTSEHYSEYLDPLQLNTEECLILPINDCTRLLHEAPTGSHWSTLIYVKSGHKFFYYDSLGKHNLSSAELVASKLVTYFVGISKKATITELNGPQQINGVDCGVYMLHAIQLIATSYIKAEPLDPNIYTNLHLSEADLITKRSLFAYICNNAACMEKHIFSLLIARREKGIYRTVVTGSDDIGRQEEMEVTDHCVSTPQWSSVRHAAGRKSKRSSFILQCSNRFSHLMDSTLEKEEEVISERMTLQKEINIRVGKSNKYKPNVLVMADSHGRRSGELLHDQLHGKFNVTTIFKPNAKLEHVTHDLKELTSKFNGNDYVVILGGTNDIPSLQGDLDKLNRQFINITNEVTKNTNVLIPGLLHRFDNPTFNPLITKINHNWNTHVKKSLKTNKRIIPMRNIYLNRSDHTRHGLHLRLRGKRKLCHAIAEAILKDYSLKTCNITNINIESQTLNDSFMAINSGFGFTESSTHLQSTLEGTSPFLGFTEESIVESEKYLSNFERSNGQKQKMMSSHLTLNSNYKSLNKTKPITVVEDDMKNLIYRFKDVSSIAFAHCISADLHAEKNMSQGVARTFKQMFGKPLETDCLSKHLSYQKVSAASVYSLITKPAFFNKPNLNDYDLAFRDLIADFKRRDLKLLICSPLGCIRDKVPLKHFVAKISEFHQSTGAEVQIVVFNEQSSRVLRSGMQFHDFVDQLKLYLLESPWSCASNTLLETNGQETVNSRGSLLADESVCNKSLTTSSEKSEENSFLDMMIF